MDRPSMTADERGRNMAARQARMNDPAQKARQGRVEAMMNARLAGLATPWSQASDVPRVLQEESRKRPSDTAADSSADGKKVCTGLEQSGTPTGHAGEGVPSGDDGWERPVDDDEDPGTGLFVPPGNADEKASLGGLPPPGKGKGDRSAPGKDDLLEWDPASQSYIPTPDKALHAKRLQEAMFSKMELATRRVRIENRVPTGDRFAPALLELIDHFVVKDLESDAVIHDANLSDPLALTLGIEGHHGLSLREWLSIEPRLDSEDESMEAWYSENVLTNMIMLDAPPQGTPGSAYVADPVALYTWLSADFDPKTQVQRIKGAINGLEANNQQLMIGDLAYDFPADDMPADAKFMVFAYNTGGHWVTIKLEPDLVTRQGKIILYDSLGGKNVAKHVTLVMPWFAALVNRRSDLTWRQTSWSVVRGTSTIQRNGSDCGPITASNCIAVLNDRAPEVHNGVAQTLAFGRQLRFDFLSKLFQLFMSKPMPGVGQNGGSNGGPSRGNGKGRGDDKSGGKRRRNGKGKGGKSGNESKPGDDKSEQLTKSNGIHRATSVLQYAISTKTRIECPDYRLHLCDALVKYGALPLDVLVTAIMFEVDDDDEYIDDEENLTALLQALLQETYFMFERQDDETWKILEGPGRSVDNATRARLLGWHPSAGSFDDGETEDVEVSWDLAIAIVRSSPSIRHIDSTHARVERCRELMKAYWNSFHDYDLPGELNRDAEGDWVLDDSSGTDWASYYHENQSSRNGVFSGTAPADAKIRSLLDTANAKGAAEERMLNVRLVANGHDGTTTENDTWASLRVDWPWLCFDLSIALSEAVTPSGMFEDGSGAGVKWGHYSVDGLRTVLEGGADPIKPPSPRAIDVDSGNSALSQLDLRTHHEQFLFICQSINCLKLDFSIEARRKELPVQAKLRNGLANVLTSCALRNTFALHDSGSSTSHFCPHCGHRALRRSELQAHIDEMHPGQPPMYSCPMCEWWGKSQKRLLAHKQYKHKGRYPCGECDYIATSPGNLKVHLANMHSIGEVKLFKCPNCGWTTKWWSGLKAHIKGKGCPINRKVVRES